MAEIVADVWLQAVWETIQNVLATSGVAPTSVASICVDEVGWMLIPVDRARNPLHPAMIWLDRRAEAETNWLKSLPEAHSLVNLDANSRTLPPLLPIFCG